MDTLEQVKSGAVLVERVHVQTGRARVEDALREVDRVRDPVGVLRLRVGQGVERVQQVLGRAHARELLDATEPRGSVVGSSPARMGIVTPAARASATKSVYDDAS